MLEHPNIVRLIDVFEERDPMCAGITLILEYFQTTLASYLQQYKVINENNAKGVINKIASGLYKCHQSGVVHCDLKPANILINIDNKLNITDLKIADFGFAFPTN